MQPCQKRSLQPVPEQTDILLIPDSIFIVDMIVNKELCNFICDTTIKIHWLAVDGKQPKIPRAFFTSKILESNMDDMEIFSIESIALKRNDVSKFQSKIPHYKYNLSSSGALYVNRVFKTLISYSKETNSNNKPFYEMKHKAIFDSLRTTPGIQQFVPTIICFIEECFKGPSINVKTIHSILTTYTMLALNPTADIEPFIHKILPKLLSLITNCGTDETKTSLNIACSQKSTYLLKLEVQEKAIKTLDLIRNMNSIKPYNIEARCIQTLAHNIKNAPNCRIEALHGSIIGINMLGGSKAVRQVLISEPLLRRMDRELNRSDLWYKNDPDYNVFLNCSSALSKALSCLPECQLLLQNKIIKFHSLKTQFFYSIYKKVPQNFLYSTMACLYIGNLNLVQKNSIKQTWKNFDMEIKSLKLTKNRKISIITRFTILLEDKLTPFLRLFS